MSQSVSRRIVLARRPVGEPKPDDFRMEEGPVPAAPPGGVLLRTLWLSLDPYMRGRMSDAPSYSPPVGIGDATDSLDVEIPAGLLGAGSSSVAAKSGHR